MGRIGVKEYSEAMGASDTEAVPRRCSLEKVCMLYGGARRRNGR